MDPNFRFCIKRFINKGRPIILWLVSLILLTLLGLSLFSLQREGKPLAHYAFQRTLQAQRALVTSGHRDELAYILDQSMILVPAEEFIRGSDYYQWVGKRLPLEAVWEKACLGTDGRLYPRRNQWRAAWANLKPLRSA